MASLHHMSRGGSGAGRGASEDQDDNARKRKRNEICRASRERVKNDKKGLKGRIGELKAEIAEEEMTNTSLDQEERMMAENLKLLQTRKTELQREFAEKEEEAASQNVKLEKLSQDSNLVLQPGFSNFDVEILRNELAVLTQVTWDDWESEKLELEMEIAALEMKNSELTTQCQILGEMIVQDWKQGNPAGH